MKKLFVKVVPNKANYDGEEYLLRATLCDKEAGYPVDQEVTFRDMGHVRSYYNGMMAGWGRVVGYGHGVQLTMFAPMTRETALYENPVNVEYAIDAACDPLALN